MKMQDGGSMLMEGCHECGDVGTQTMRMPFANA